MKLVQQRLLRGVNRYAPTPCLLAQVDLEQAATLDEVQLADLTARLHAVLPGVSAPTFANPAALLVQIWSALHQAVGAAPGFTHIEAVGGRPGQWRIVLAYQLEHVAQGALTLALALLDALIQDQPFDLAAGLEALQERATKYRLSAAAEQVRAEALAAGIPVMRLSEHAHLLQLGWGSRQWRYLEGVDGSGGGPLLGGAVARDRQLVRALLDEAAIPVPRGAMADNLQDACRIARRLGGPVAVRPLDPQLDYTAPSPCQGDDEDAVAQAFGLASRHGGRAMIERVLDEQIATVQVRGGRFASDGVTDALHALAARAATKIGLAEADVDIAVGAGGQRTLVAGIRATGLDPVAAASTRGDGRIPVIAVTGTNGKTTTTLMIAHAARLAGLRTGCTTTQGVFHGETALARGDCTGYWSHRTVLASPDVDLAVLETARGGILKRGLAFDRCAVGVLLNVSDDHLGLDGIDTVEDLAKVKGLVIECAERAAVLNADDPNCVALAARLRHGPELLYFSMQPAGPVLDGHLAAGGRALCLADEALVLCEGAARQLLMRADAIPCTLGGHARFNIANSLAAAAALIGAGFTPAQVVQALASFVSDAHTNPLRLNLFDVGGIRLIVDYAHNPAAYQAVGAMARAIAPRQVVGIVTSPGDRRDADLQRIGQTCASHFDKLVVYESASRGRPYGEAATLIRKGAESAAIPSQQIVQRDDEADAIRQGMQLCEPGDVLAFFCGSNLDAVVDALRRYDVQAAEQLAAQIH